MFARIVILSVLGLGCGLIQRVHINKKIDEDDSEQEPTLAGKIGEAFLPLTLGISIGAFLSLIVGFIVLTFMTLAAPITIPFLIISVGFRAFYIKMAYMALASGALVVGNIVSFKLGKRPEPVQI